MKVAVIDVGSNSVRLLMPNNINKQMTTTQLGEDTVHTKILIPSAIKRTVEAIEKYYKFALDNGAKEVKVFATEAVRSAKNNREFVKELDRRNIALDILSTEEEALAGYLGASQGGKACVFDVGGASTELIVGEDKVIKYSKSLPLGIVRLKDLCPSQNIKELTEIVNNKIKEYGKIPEFDYVVGIGGSSSTIVSILMGGFDREKVHNYKLTMSEIDKCLDILVNSEDKTKIKGLEIKRASVIIGGVIMCKQIMKMLNVDHIIVSETDNMEGYLINKNIL